MAKRHITIEIDAEVLEFLKSRRNEHGSVSRQLEQLARDLMRHKSDQKRLMNNTGSGTNVFRCNLASSSCLKTRA